MDQLGETEDRMIFLAETLVHSQEEFERCMKLREDALLRKDLKEEERIDLENKIIKVSKNQKTIKSLIQDMEEVRKFKSRASKEEVSLEKKKFISEQKQEELAEAVLGVKLTEKSEYPKSALLVEVSRQELENFGQDLAAGNEVIPQWRNPTFKTSIENNFVPRDDGGRLPSNLPHFRGKSGIEDPQEFLEVFNRTCRASGIKVTRYPTIMALCLDNIDARWMESWLDKNLTTRTSWTEVESAFISHFQNPNASAIWLAQMRSLKMENFNVQRYSDQFMKLAEKLHWNLESEMAIYQYKSGLTHWMLDQLSVAESNHLLAMETQLQEVKPISVEILAKLAIRIEANKKLQVGKLDMNVRREVSFNFSCFNCGRKGHRQEDCRLPPKKKEEETHGRRELSFEKKKIDVTSVVCWKCNKSGHYAGSCPDLKKVKEQLASRKVKVVEVMEKTLK